MSEFWRRFANRRVSRRTALRAMGSSALGAGLMAVAGCDSGSSSDPSSVPGQRTSVPDRPDVLNPAAPPQRGGVFNTSEAAEFGTFDPHIGIALASAYFPRVYNVLVNQSAAKPEFMYFDLASELEMPDDQTFVFRLRPDVVVGPNELGVPERALDAEDVRVNIERIQTTPTASSYAFAKEYIESVTPAGAVVSIRTTRPYAWFLNRIGLFFNTIAPRELLLGDVSRMTSAAAGAGPFVLKSLREGQGAEFVRNPNYYRKDDATGEQLPFADSIDLRVILDRATARTAFIAGQLDRYVPGDSIEASELANDYVIQRDPNFSYVAFTMNVDRPPFDDPRVRRAFSRGINREQYVEIVYRGDAKANGLVHWPVGSYALDPDELATTYQPFDVEEAHRLVNEVGGIRVPMVYPAESFLLEHDKHFPIFVEQMKAVGIELDLQPQSLTNWIDSYYNRDYVCSLALNQIYETPEIPLGFHTTGGPLGDGSYVQGLGDPEIEAAVKKSRETIPLEERIQAVHDAQKLIYQKDPMILPLVSGYNYQAYHRTVHDIPAGVGTTSFLLNTYWLET